MTRLIFQTPVELDDRLRQRVQVEVLDSELASVGRASINDGFEVKHAGAYAARVTLPDGTCLAAAVHAPAEGEVVVKLAPVTGESIPQPARDSLVERLRSIELSDFSDLGAGIGHAVTYWSTRGQFPALPAERTRIRRVTGNPFKQELTPLGPPEVYGVGQRFRIEAEAKQVFLQLKDPTVSIVVPLRPSVEGAAEAIDVLMVKRAGKAYPQFIFDNPDLDLLFRYASTGLAAPVASFASSSAAVLAERAFRGNPSRPFSAAAGAFALLRLGDTKDMAWTGEFADKFAWFADAAIVHAEVLARAGKHQAALMRLMEIPARGVPFISIGLSLALARLYQYERASSAKRLALPDHFQTVLRQLSSLRDAVDFSCPVLTYRSLEFKGGGENA